MARRILCRRASLRRPRTPCELAAALKGTPPYPRPCRGLGIRRDHQALDAPLGGQDGAVEQVGATVRAGRAPRVRVEPSWPGRSSGGRSPWSLRAGRPYLALSEPASLWVAARYRPTTSDSDRLGRPARPGGFLLACR